MTRVLAEQPILLSVLLGLMAAGCLYGWLQSGRRGAALAGLFLLALIPVAWIIAANWETDREQITKLLRQTAAAVERNDFESVYEVIHPDLQSVRRRARAELPQYEFQEAKIASIRKIEPILGAEPAEMNVDLNVSVTVTHRGGTLAETKLPRRLLLRMQKLDQRWYVTEYTHQPLVGGPDAYSPMGD